MQQTIRVVDSFYADPLATRELALKRGKWLPQQGRYSVETANAFFTSDLVNHLQDLVHSRITFDPQTMGFGVFALYLGGAPVELTTHYDDTDWSAIVYLTPDLSCEGGIGFYRHQPSGLVGPPSEAEAARLGFESSSQWLSELYPRAKLNPSEWELIDYVSMKFNRCVLLRGGRRFHRTTSEFGAGPSDGRLTQRFFFNEA